jgi:hypothetical protein
MGANHNHPQQDLIPGPSRRAGAYKKPKPQMRQQYGDKAAWLMDKLRGDRLDKCSIRVVMLD